MEWIPRHASTALHCGCSCAVVQSPWEKLVTTFIATLVGKDVAFLAVYDGHLPDPGWLPLAYRTVQSSVASFALDTLRWDHTHAVRVQHVEQRHNLPLHYL